MKTSFCVALGLTFLTLSSVQGQSSYDPKTSQTFDQFVAGMHPLRYYAFGTGSGSNVTNLTQLAQAFSPYGIAGTTVEEQEWERYQPFNSTNFVFTSHALNLTATLHGGLYSGGINSGQIWTKETFKPQQTGYTIYAISVRMKVPNAWGSWTSAWLYTKQSGQGDGSEIDNPEFFMMNNQNQYDWTGYNHGPGKGYTIYTIKQNKWVWEPGIDFSADYHSYELVWTPDATYKYVDGRLIDAQTFKWTAPGAGQLGINLAVGSSASGLYGLQPRSTSEFPIVNSIETIGIWGK